jgi:hypothetical protein
VDSTTLILYVSRAGLAANIRPYRFKDAATLVEDFWAEVDKRLREKEVIE